MESYCIQDYVNHRDTSKHHSDTIVSMIGRLKEDFEHLFEYEKDWDYVWELI